MQMAFDVAGVPGRCGKIMVKSKKGHRCVAHITHREIEIPAENSQIPVHQSRREPRGKEKRPALSRVPDFPAPTLDPSGSWIRASGASESGRFPLIFSSRLLGERDSDGVRTGFLSGLHQDGEWG